MAVPFSNTCNITYRLFVTISYGLVEFELRYLLIHSTMIYENITKSVDNIEALSVMLYSNAGWSVQ